MSRLHSEVPAVVVDSHDYGESDKIITLFCRDLGRLTGIAKGAHRSKKRFVNKLELFSFLQITCTQSAPGRLPVILEAELLNGFIGLRTNLSAYRSASIIRELILLASNEKLQDDNLFQLLLWALHSLDQGRAPRPVVALFLVKLLDFVGYRPDLSRCQRCGTPWLENNSGRFTPLTGGLTCPSCRLDEDRGGINLSAGAIRTMTLVQQQPPARLNRCKLSGSILQETLDCLHRYGRHLFQREIHSWKWLPPP